MSSEAEVKRLWRSADAVCFDVDSTVCCDEGLDELANFCGVGSQVAEWTKKAMGGGVSFREALQQRLNIVKPSQQHLSDFIASHPPKLSPRITELISKLQQSNKKVFLVSGGFRDIITPVANLLSIPLDCVYANRLIFNEDGSYAGFDLDEPTSESGGKPRVVGVIKRKYDLNTMIMIGDGATDMEAVPPADAFIGYGGNVIREKVRDNSHWFVTDFQQLIDELS
ncbi:phosphoserine phosphatase isoform X2 [Aplysia californica]|nr:phosphoserine phosphatase isoform X2 [Aplysia californica]XP_035825778.1 phosphoserine phosphatase isoform X2 [Aplysia californica]